MAEFPEMIGKYAIEALVAKGGMGAVYKAMHPTLRRHVIIKKLSIRGNSAIAERFKREARILMDFKCEHIVHVYDHFKEGNTNYIVLEFVDGMSLDLLIRKRRYLSSQLSLMILLDACKALKYAHDKGVIHRDIKPGNILISKKGEIKLADFGIASSEEEDDSGLTKEGMTLGTPSYMPPEQFENTRNVDKRADIYAMGVMLYEMVSGKKPFPGNFARDTIIQIQKGRYISVKKVNPEVSPLIVKLIRKMIRPDPRKRFQDMGTVIKILEKYLGRYAKDAIRSALVNLMTAAAGEEPEYKARKRKRFFLIPLLVLLAGLAYAAWYGYGHGYLFRILYPDTYGAARISVRVPKTVKAADELFLKAKFYTRDDSEKKDASGLSVNLRHVPTEAADPYYSFESDITWLKAGSYRVKVLVEQSLIWQAVYLEPLSMSANPLEAAEEIQFRFDVPAVQPVSIRHKAFNAISGDPIDGETSFSVSMNGSWKPLDELEALKIESGKTWKFRAQAPGHYTEIYSINIANGQDEVQLYANLVPVPGKLNIEGPQGFYKLFLNGSQTFVLGGQDMKLGSLKDFKGGKSSWQIPSGSIELEIISGSMRKNLQLTVPPEGQITAIISMDNNTITIRKKE